MNITRPCRWAITVTLVTISAVVVGAVPAQSQLIVGSGSVGSRPGGNHETSKPAKPRAANPADNLQNSRPSDMLSQTQMRLQRAQALEERLRRGQMDESLAQGQISERLEQFHKGLTDGSIDETATGQSVQ